VQQEPDPRIRAIWELHLNQELAHLRQACEFLRRFDGREPEELLPPALPEPVRFEPNKEYVRHLLATQLDLTTRGAGYVREQHERFQWMQRQLNDSMPPPSERVIEMHRERMGSEYRVEPEGEHPVADLREEVRHG
jgi:hypothetical protein